MSKHFPLPLVVKFINGITWELVKPFEYHSKGGDIIKVPKGFKSDFASIPSIFWSFIGSPTGRYGPSAIVHDYCYATQLFSRSKADKIFLEAMKVLEVSWWKRYTMYWAVRIAMSFVWKKRKKELSK